MKVKFDLLCTASREMTFDIPNELVTMYRENPDDEEIANNILAYVENNIHKAITGDLTCLEYLDVELNDIDSGLQNILDMDLDNIER